MNKRLIAMVLVSVTAAALSACSSGPDHGFVIQKKYTAGYTYTYEQPIPHEVCTEEEVGSSMSDNCSTSYTYIPEQRYQPPEWQLEVSSDGKTGWIDVSHSAYNGVHKGDYYGKESN